MEQTESYIREHRFMSIVADDGFIVPLSFMDTAGKLNENSMKSFISNLERGSRDMLISGAFSKIDEAITATMTSMYTNVVGNENTHNNARMNLWYVD